MWYIVQGGIWQKDKISPNKHVIMAYGTAVVALPSQIAYSGGVEKHLVIALWSHYKSFNNINSYELIFMSNENLPKCTLLLCINLRKPDKK